MQLCLAGIGCCASPGVGTRCDGVYGALAVVSPGHRPLCGAGAHGERASLESHGDGSEIAENRADQSGLAEPAGARAPRVHERRDLRVARKSLQPQGRATTPNRRQPKQC